MRSSDKYVTKILTHEEEECSSGVGLPFGNKYNKLRLHIDEKWCDNFE